MKVVVDRDRCIGAGQCVMATAEVFDQDEGNGYVELLEPTPRPALEAATRHAAAVCPSSAIRLIED